MKKFLLSFLIIGTFAVYALSLRKDDDENIVITPPPGLSLTPSPSPTSSSTDPSPTPVTKAAFKDGSYTGTRTDAYYGYIQVQAVIKNGKLADVKFLEYPNDRPTSVNINTQAMPYLKQEAILAQNANVDIVSGATDSSHAFNQSLASALLLAKN